MNNIETVLDFFSTQHSVFTTLLFTVAKSIHTYATLWNLEGFRSLYGYEIVFILTMVLFVLK